MTTETLDGTKKPGPARVRRQPQSPPFGHDADDAGAENATAAPADPGESANGVVVTDYDANGEARDAIAELAPEQPSLLPEPDPEMHDGKIVREHRVAFGGRVDVSLGWPNERAFWDELRVGRTGQLTVNYEVGDDTYRIMTDEGVVIGLRRVRKLNVYSIHFAPAETNLDGLPLFENGVVNEAGSDPVTSGDVGEPEPAAGVLDSALAEALGPGV